MLVCCVVLYCIVLCCVVVFARMLVAQITAPVYRLSFIDARQRCLESTDRIQQPIIGIAHYMFACLLIFSVRYRITSANQYFIPRHLMVNVSDESGQFRLVLSLTEFLSRYRRIQRSNLLFFEGERGFMSIKTTCESGSCSV